MAESARAVAASALARAAKHYPDLSPSELGTHHLSPADARLATAIHRVALQRWITLDALLKRHLRKSSTKLDATVHGILLGGMAQLLFMNRLPVYAVVNESVDAVKAMGQPRAAGLVNAVLRKVADLVGEVEPDLPWQPGANALPLDTGTLVLTEPWLPPIKDFPRHLSVATSHPLGLVKRWLEAYEREAVMAACEHGVSHPPTFVFEADGSHAAWRGGYDELTEHLAADPRRRVQDPASARPVASTADLPITTALDFCAGRGTKTRQLATLHPAARIYATDVDHTRRVDLETAPETYAGVRVVEPTDLPDEPVDLLLLDVPCSNTGVLARRPEARYRFSEDSLAELVDLQRQIVTELLPHVRDDGWLLYSTCSLEPEENRQQRDWIVATTGATLLAEEQVLPAGRGASSHDGSYHALLQLP